MTSSVKDMLDGGTALTMVTGRNDLGLGKKTRGRAGSNGLTNQSLSGTLQVMGYCQGL